jgi:hypothetical protein
MTGFHGSRIGEFQVRFSDTLPPKTMQRLDLAGTPSMCSSAHLNRHALQD